MKYLKQNLPRTAYIGICEQIHKKVPNFVGSQPNLRTRLMNIIFLNLKINDNIQNNRFHYDTFVLMYHCALLTFSPVTLKLTHPFPPASL